MKNLAKLSVVCVVLALAGSRAGAQNLVQNITINLSGYDQSPAVDNGTNTTQTATSILVATKTVIQALAASLAVTFSAKAELQFVLDTNGVLQSVVVSDGGQQTDVSLFVTVTDGTYVSKSKTSDSTGAGSQTSYGIREFTLSIANALSFDVQGFTTIAATTTAGSGGTTTTVVQFTAAVAGTGTDANGNTVVLKGTITGTKD